MAESMNQVVMELDRLKDDLKNYQYNNDQNLKEFKKETRAKIDKLDERIDVVEDNIHSLNSRMTVIESFLKEIKENTQWTKRALITALLTGAVGLLVSAIVYFVSN